MQQVKKQEKRNEFSLTSIQFFRLVREFVTIIKLNLFFSVGITNNESHSPSSKSEEFNLQQLSKNKNNVCNRIAKQKNSNPRFMPF